MSANIFNVHVGWLRITRMMYWAKSLELQNLQCLVSLEQGIPNQLSLAQVCLFCSLFIIPFLLASIPAWTPITLFFSWLLFDVCVNQCHSILLLPWLMSWLTSGRYLMTNWNCYRNQSRGKHHDTKGMATYSEFLPVVFSCYWNKCEMSAQRVLSTICCSSVSPKASVFIYPDIWRMITSCKVVCLLMDVIVMPWCYWHVGRGQG